MIVEVRDRSIEKEKSLDRVYITGAKGMLGQAVAEIFSERYEVCPHELSETDVTDVEKIIEDICSFEPKFVIHLAAMTDVDGCEKNPDSAFRVNALGTRNVALACQKCDATLVYLSTGSVYNGEKCDPYTEFDTPDPHGAYAVSKYQGELFVKDLLSKFYIFYTCWLFGSGSSDKKFVAKFIEMAKESKTLRIIDDHFGSPTYTVDLARAIFDFIETGLYGKYHCVNEGKASRYDVAKEILRIAGMKNHEVVPVSSAEFPLPAPRPRNESMRNYHFELLGRKPMRKWQEALEEYIKSAFFK